MDDGNAGSTKVLAVCGKGGVGKTSISALIIQLLLNERAGKILAIDADPATGLATALGIQPRKTVNDIRNDLIGRVESGAGGDRRGMIEHLDYEVMTALEERGNLAFLAIGRPEKEGCYCQVNDFLKEIIESAARNFSYVVIDGEAGIEQVNRRVMERVTHLILVSDASARGINVAHTIRSVADSAVLYNTVGIILNRIKDRTEIEAVRMPDDIPFLGWVPESDAIRTCDISGGSILDLKDDSALIAVKSCIERLDENAHRDPAYTGL
ncbi:MAG: AAA family ATPase [Spirochaetes bacterium]|nr:AAA family ATPase [Spirochaetota bacterium]